MDTRHPEPADPRPAGGQTLRLPGSSRAVTLHEQLYRYADDLHLAIERSDALEADNHKLRESTSRLLESREELEAILHTSLDIHLLADEDGVIRQANPASAALAPAQTLTGSRLVEWVADAYQDDFTALQLNMLAGLRCPDEGVELRLRRHDASLPPLIVVARVLVVRRSLDQRQLHWILRDVTHLRETEFETRIASTVFSNSEEGVMITDIEGGILAVNAAFTTITGYEAAEAVGQKPSFLASGHQSVDFYEMFWQALRTAGTWQGVLYNRRKNGEVYLERLSVNAVRDTDGRILSFIAVFSDLGRKQHAGRPLLPHPAFGDPLTGLANADLFHDRLERMMLQARRAQAPFSLILVDLDGFSAFNRHNGHLAGDRLLRATGTRLASGLRASDTTARIGADSFAILAAGLEDDVAIDRICAKCLAALRAPLDIEGESYAITASIGAAKFPRHATDPERLLAVAREALESARIAGGDRAAIHPGAGSDSANSGTST